MADVAVSVVVERSRTLAELGVADVKLFRIANVLETIQKVVDDAEKKRFTEKAVEDWLSMLEQTCHRFEEVLDELEHALLKRIVSPHEQKKVCSFTRSSCLSFRKSSVRFPIKEILDVIAQVDQISEARHEFNFVVPEPTAPRARQVQSTSSIHEQAVFGRERDREYLVDKLVTSVVYQQSDLQILSLVGMGGIGKTALAQLVYNDSRVEACFDVRIWICVSGPFDEIGIAKQIIESVGKVMDTNLDLSLNLMDCISGKKFLLILDDVWKEDYAKWEPLKNSLGHGRAGSKILVTTRNDRVAWMMGTMENDVYHVGPLSDDACWLLLRNTLVLVGNEEKLTIFDNIGKEMAKKCKGFPFAAKTLGSVLRCKNTLEEWTSVLREEIWELISKDFLPLSFLSLRHCFSYCSVFPKDSWIEVEKLIQIWIALGYFGIPLTSFVDRTGIRIDLRGRQYFDDLAMHSLFQDLMRGCDGQIKRCKMNGIVHDFARFLRRRRNTGTKKTTCGVCDPLVVSNVEAFRSLFLDSDSSLKICGCLKSLRVLKMTSKLQRIPREMEKLINLTWLELGGNKLSREEAKTICKLYKLQFLSFCVDEVPWEIGNLVRLILLDLSYSGSLTELPDSIRSLRELRTLNISFCPRLSKLPEAIFGLRMMSLQHLLNSGTTSLKQLPEGLMMYQLLTLSEFRGGSGRSKLRRLKELNKLMGSLSLKIRLAVDDDLAEMVEDAKEAELMNKIDIRELEIIFEDEMDEKEETVKARVDVLDALKPTEYLQELHVWFYNGPSLPDWITSHVTMLRSVKLYSFNHLSSLPPLGELPHLEEIYMAEMRALQFVGREFLGIKATGGGGSFPSLKELTFNHCPQWNEWEDITEEEEESARLMPRLEKLTIVACPRLSSLPHRLLGKLPSSLKLNIMSCSTNLQHSNYKDHASSSQLMQS